MDHLTREELAVLQALLDDQLRRLERSMRATEEALKPVQLDQTAVGRLSRIDALQGQGLTRNLRERERVQLAQVQSAFRRISEGSYGICVDCGSKVPFGRLHVMPETASCTACSAA